jgi:hypothetical protein
MKNTVRARRNWTLKRQNAVTSHFNDEHFMGDFSSIAIVFNDADRPTKRGNMEGICVLSGG